MTQIWFATSNAGKMVEFKALFSAYPCEIHTQNELSFFSQPPETGKTFIENARIKAKALSAVKSDCWVIGEDSGLEVEGLGGLPGIFSARYAGDKAADSENVAKVLKMMKIKAAPNRNAQFRCAIVCYSPKGEEIICEGELKGKISEKVRGQTGFGYDPIFIPDGEEKTLAELGPGPKNKISHRAKALRLLIPKIF